MPQKNTMTVRKMSAILGQIRSFLTALPFLRAFTDHLVQFIKKQYSVGLGPSNSDSHGPKRTIKRPKNYVSTMARKTFSYKKSAKKNGSRLFRLGLGRNRPKFRSLSTRILEVSSRPPYKCKRSNGCNSHSQKFCKKERKSISPSGQHHHFLVLQKTRRKKGKIQQPFEAFYSLVFGQKHRPSSSVGQKCRYASRWFIKNEKGQRGLHFKSISFSPHVDPFSTTPHPIRGNDRHVCLPGECKVSPILLQASSLAEHGHRLPQQSSSSSEILLQQPPLDHNKTLASQASTISRDHLLDSGALLGFKLMVSPTQEAHSPQKSFVDSATFPGHVSELLCRVNAQAQMAPSFLSTIRKMLQREQISVQAQETYLAKLGDCRRYDSAFKKLWALCQINGVHPENASTNDVAEQILLLYDFSPSDARNAYSACLMLPGFSSLRFSFLLQKCKKQWSRSTPKYCDFWDPSPLLQKLLSIPFSWENLADVRNRLILVLKIFHLMRSIDCARIQRTISFIDNRPFILVQRKGWLSPRWEEIMSFSANQKISPWHLLLAYVNLTDRMASPGDPLFLNLKRPFRPLTSDRIATLTKKILTSLGLQGHWGAHSTRGAGVYFYKTLGLSSEQVAELGKWKDIKTFSEFYLRLQSTKTATNLISNLPWVHTVSPGDSADPDMSQSPPKNSFEGGRSDMEGEAQDTGEPTLTLPKTKRALSHSSQASMVEPFRKKRLPVPVPISGLTLPSSSTVTDIPASTSTIDISAPGATMATAVSAPVLFAFKVPPKGRPEPPLRRPAGGGGAKKADRYAVQNTNKKQ